MSEASPSHQSDHVLLRVAPRIAGADRRRYLAKAVHATGPLTRLRLGFWRRNLLAGLFE